MSMNVPIQQKCYSSIQVSEAITIFMNLALCTVKPVNISQPRESQKWPCSTYNLYLEDELFLYINVGILTIGLYTQDDRYSELAFSTSLTVLGPCIDMLRNNLVPENFLSL